MPNHLGVPVTDAFLTALIHQYLQGYFGGGGKRVRSDEVLEALALHRVRTLDDAHRLGRDRADDEAASEGFP